MSAFSFTAPIVSDEEFNTEILALTEEEKNEIYYDVHGKRNNTYIRNNDNNHILNKDKNTESQIDPVNTSQLLQTLNKSLIDIPDKDKQDYLEAVDKVPDLVNTESNPLIFLEYENYNSIEAAKRMVHYWKLRTDLFGKERAFLPMTLNGAMLQDADVFHKGVVQLLPNDSHGRSVLFFDRVRATKTVISRDEILRLFFYASQIVSHRKTKTERSLVTIVSWKGFDLYMHFDRTLSKKRSILLHGVPVYIMSCHGYTGSGKSVVTLIMPVFRHIFGKDFRLRFTLHAGSDNEILERLATYGIMDDHIEKIVNGSYKRCNEINNHWFK